MTTSTAGIPPKAGGAAATAQQVLPTFDNMYVNGRLRTPAITNRENMRNVIQRSLTQIHKEFQKSTEDFYLLHTWSSPIPISLTSFITNVTRTSRLNGSTVRITMKMPFAFSRTVFSDEVDAITTGHFLTVRHFSSQEKTESSMIFEKGANGKVKRESVRVRPRTTSFMGMITNISQQFNNMSGVDNYSTITITAKDFIEPIRNCNYIIMPGNLRSAEDGETTSLPNQDEFKFLSQFIMNSKEWADHIKDMAGFAAEEQDFKLVMENFLVNFGYMLLPPSLGIKMIEIAATAKKFHDASAAGQGVARQAASAVGTPGSAGGTWETSGDMALTATLLSMSSQYEYFKSMELLSSVSGRELGFLSRREIIARAKARRKAAASRGTSRERADASLESAGTAPIKRGNERGSGLQNTLMGERIGDTIVVATKKADVPKTSIWYQMLPEKPPYQRFLQKFQGALQTRSSAWQRIVGTFQSDNRMIEMIPVMIPFYEEDMINTSSTEVEVSATAVGGRMGARIDRSTSTGAWQPKGNLSKALGAQPTLIYRIKPRHWNTQLNQDYLNKVYKDYVDNYFTDGIYPIQYSLAAEFPSLNIDTQTLMQESLLGLTGDHVETFSANWDEADRVNGTYIESSLIQNRSGYETGVLSTPVIDIYDAYKYGLRLFEGTYPFFHVKSQPTEPLPATATDADAGMRALGKFQNKKFNDAFAEQMFLTYGNGNRYAKGTITTIYQAGAKWSPGKWGYMFIRPFGQGEDHILERIGGSEFRDVAMRGTKPGQGPGGSDDYGSTEQAAYYWANYNQLGGVENTFFFYIDTISHNTMVMPNGVKKTRTTIGFSRGAWHKLPPIMPEIHFVQKALKRGEDD